MSVLSDLAESIADAPGEFADVATQGPVEALLVAMGAVLIIAPMVFFGLLVLGAVVEFVTPDRTAVQHP